MRHEAQGLTWRSKLAWLGPAALALTLAGCGGDSLPKLRDLNPFAEKQQPLPGKRIAVLDAPDKVGSELAPADKPIALPVAQTNPDWTQPGGTPTNAPGHLMIGATLRTVWSADVGTGSSSYGRLTASPIVADGRIYTLDAAGRVSAFSTTGAAIWRVSVSPSNERAREGYGGGLAAEGGRIYVGTGYGIVVALEARTGKKLWEKNLGVPVRTSPTAAGDKLFVMTAQGRFYCLSGADGSEVWTFRGLPERMSILANVSPAVDGETVIIPYPSGEVVALKVSDGQQLWTESLSGSTRSTSGLAAISDAARPAIAGGTVYAVGHGGRMLATSQRSGELIWSANIASIQAPWVAGGSVFVVDINGRLMALSRQDGKVQWTTKLPGDKTWSGPVLAGGRLWLTSSKGRVISVDAMTGKIGAQLSVGQPVFIAPVVAQGRMYVLTDKARLIALN
ncbi:MAG: PQQ-binding-like beta-propeller repeat protein [Hyphomicrobiaceae bacterium]|nr:PQQ-binding-like beta-propeller repeat protein [Hyphomicrobiaceae bacterium]